MGMDETELCYTPATELRERYLRRELSPVEVTGAILARIERVNPVLNAFITVTADRALQQAAASETRYRDGTARPLEGIPISIKDNHATRGIRTTSGSLLYRDRVPDEDSLFVERVTAAGAPLLGKTNLPEFGWKGASNNRLGPPTHNPWQHGRTAGGSSSGAAAGVASGLGPLAQGGDGAGSIRIPAAFCGVFGFKGSFGLIPYPGTAAAQLAHAGPLTRTVRDAALLVDAVVGADARDRLCFDSPGGFLAACDQPVRGLRVAWSPDLGYAEVAPEVRELAQRAAQRFSDLGCDVDEVDPGIADPWEIIDVIWSANQAGTHAENYDAVRDQLDPGLLPVIERGRQLSAVDLSVAKSRREEYYHAMGTFMERYDLLLTPALPVTAFGVDEDYPSEINGKPMTYLGWTAFTYPFNLTGQPAATVPCGFAADGLPVGLQLVGRWRDDATVFRAAAAFEEAAPWAGARPALD